MINKEYLRRNRLHAASVGVYYGIKSMLERIEQCWSKKPLWLVKALKVELEKAEHVHHEMAAHRNETSPTAEAKEASTQPTTGDKSEPEDITRDFNERHGVYKPKGMDITNANTFPRGFLG